MRQFWTFRGQRNADGTLSGAELRIDGPIEGDNEWWADEQVTCPAPFRRALEAVDGNLVVAINSPGGDVIAASCIYTMLRHHSERGHNVTVRIEGMAASAASVIAMAGDIVQISPTAYIMIHDPWSCVSGNAEDMRKCSEILDEIAEGIVNAYVLKTGMEHDSIRALMKAETWLSARKAVEMHFADVVLYSDEGEDADDTGSSEALYARASTMRVLARVSERARLPVDEDTNQDTQQDNSSDDLRRILIMAAQKGG